MARTSGALASLLRLLPLFIVLPYVVIKLHYALPDPVIELHHPQTGLSQLSETAILSHVRHLSENIGFRTVGTREHAQADAWLLEQANMLKARCGRFVAANAERGRKLECEVWRQEGSGSHRFDMMNKIVYKHYVNLSNIIVRISDGTPAGKEHALLINSHLDSTLPSPGAADDAISVGVMLECMRVLIETPDWEPTHALVFLFNNAEESLQDGSHLYATQHETASSIRAVINLEAAGTTGPELLFQATSEEMIEAYSHVPRPYGTVIANDVFSSGVLLSDTDFRQFQEYQNLTGLDMAIVGNSYVYHTRKDTLDMIEPGVAQHMAENTMALLKYLSSPESPLPKLRDYTPPKTVYFSLMGKFFVQYSFETATRMYASMLAISLVLATATVDFRRWRVYAKGAVGVGGALIGSLMASNIVAVLMSKVLGKGMSWFSREWYCLILYTPPALVGVLTSQLLVSSPTSSSHLEHSTFLSLHLFYALSASLLQAAGLGSAGVFFLQSLSSFAALATNAAISVNRGKKHSDINLASYALLQIAPLVIGVELSVGFLDFFVPLTGRMGEVAPVENIIATITAVITFLVLPITVPFAHRFGRPALFTATVFLSVVSIASMVFFSRESWSPFDPDHQKRFFALQIENITSGEHSLHIAACDAAPKFDTLVNELVEEFGVKGQEASLNEMDDWNPDWDIIYPFSQFVTPYRLDMPSVAGYSSPWAGKQKFDVVAMHDVADLAGNTRNLTLRIDHPGIIWTAVAFDAHVLSWDLDDKPPPENTRHHIKEASFYGTDSWTVSMVIKTTGNETGLPINFMGIQEKGMWPGKKHEGEGFAMNLFEKLDQWIFDKTDDGVDAMLLGCVAGVTVV